MSRIGGEKTCRAVHVDFGTTKQTSLFVHSFLVFVRQISNKKRVLSRSRDGHDSVATDLVESKAERQTWPEWLNT